MSGGRRPVERIVDLAIAVPVSFASAARQLVPIGVTRMERRIARGLARRARPVRREEAGPASAPRSPADPPTTDAAEVADVVDAVDAADVARPPHAGVPDDLAIDGYDQLSARQIVDRLPTLSAAELAAVEAHERSHRRRQTVLARIAQLT